LIDVDGNNNPLLIEIEYNADIIYMMNNYLACYYYIKKNPFEYLKKMKNNKEGRKGRK